MLQSAFVSKISFVNWLRNLAAPKKARRARRRETSRARPRFEILEDRLAPANLAEAGGIITLSLTASNETVTIFSKGANLYHLTTTDTTNGFITGGLVAPSSFSTPSGSTSGDLTVNPADTQIRIVDGAFTGGHIIFADSGTNPYAQNFNINLTNANANNIDFFGTSTFDNSLAASTTRGTVTVEAGAVVNLIGGAVTTSTLQQTATGGAVNINGTVTTNAAETALTVNAFRSINESATGVFKTNAATTVTFALTTAGVGNIFLNGGPNDFAGTVNINETGTGTINTLTFRNTDPAAVLPNLLAVPNNYTLVTDNTSIVLANGPNLPNTVNFNYSAGSDITQSAALTFPTATFTVLGNNSILLNFAAGNTIGTVSFNAPKGDNTTQVSYIGSADVNLGNSTLGLGTFKITALNGDITQAFSTSVSEKIGAAGSTFTYTTGGTSTVDLSNAGNNFEGPIKFVGPSTTISLLNDSLLPQFPTMPTSVTDLTLTYSNAPVTLPNLTGLLPALANLTVTAQGIFQQQGVVTFKGNTTSGSATVTSVSSLTGLAVGQTVTGPGITAGTTIAAIGTTTITLSQNATATATAVTLTAGSSITVSGAAVFSAGNNPIVLGPNNPNSFLGTISVSNAGPNQVVINAAGSLQFGGVTSNIGNGTLTVTAVGNITQVGTNAGAILQAANAGQTSFLPGPGSSVTLTNGANLLQGIVDLTTSGGGSANIADGTSMTMGMVNISGTGTLTLSAGGDLTQDPGTTITVATSSNLSAGGNITLDNNGNTFHGAPSATDFVSLSPGNNATIRASGGPINLGASSVTGNLIVRAGGNITQVGPITGPTTSALFDAGTNAVILTNPGNDFSGETSVVSTGRGTVATFKGNTTSGSTTVSNVSSVANLASGQTVSGPGIPAGTTIMTVGATSITLSQAATATATGVSLTANVPVQLTSAGDIQVGRMDLGTGPGIGVPALILTAGGNILEAGSSSDGITQAPLAGAAGFTMQQGRLDASFTGNTTSGSTTVSNVSSVAGLVVGQTVAGPGIAAGTTITAIGTTTITLSQAATTTATTVALTAGVNEIQALAFTATTGSFALAFEGQETVALPANATAAAVQTALQNLSTIGAGNVLVTGTAGNFVVTFQKALANTNVAPLTLVSAGNIVLNSNGSIALDNPNNNWSGLIDLTTATAVTGLALNNMGSINFVGTPAITGSVTLTAGQNITMPNLAYTFNTFVASAKETDVSQNITTTGSVNLGGVRVGIQFSGAANLTNTAGTTLDTSASTSANMVFNGDVNTSGALTLNLATGRRVNFNQGTWRQGSNALTIGLAGSVVSFNIGNGVSPATFNMISGTISMTGGGNVNVSRFAIFEVGTTTTTTTVDTVTVSNGTGSIRFNAFSTLSVGLGATNDQLVDASGNVVIAAGARLTAYSGVAGAVASPVLTAATAGRTVTGFFALTFDPHNANSPHVFLMGTDIVVPDFSTNALTIREAVTGDPGVTVSATGTVTGFEPDSDKYVITASTGATAKLTTAKDVNGALDIVIRNAPGAVTLTITTTKNLGDGVTAIGGIAVDGPGAATIMAANTTLDTSSTGLSPFGDIIVQGPLVALTLRDFLGNTANYQDFIRAGGTNALSTTITGRIFDSVSISMPTVLNTLTLTQYTNTLGLDTVTAERYGAIKTTGVANTFVLGDFIVSRLTNLNTADSSMAGLGTVTIANQIGGQFDIQKPVTSVTAKLANLFSLGLPGGANNPNGDLMTNVTTLSLGIVTNSNIESIGNVSSTTATSWVSGNLLANSFATITITGNATLPAAAGPDAIFGNFTGITLTATGNAAGVGLGTLTVAGDAGSAPLPDTFNIVSGNVSAATVSRQFLSSTLNAGVVTPLDVIVDPVNSTVGTITAGVINTLTLNARLLTSINAIGNAPAGIFGDIGSATVVIEGNPNGAASFTGVGLGTVKTARNLQNSSFTVVNGSMTTVSVGYQMSNDDVLLLNNAGKLGSVTAGAWNGQLNTGLVAQSIGSITTSGVPQVGPSSPLLIGDLGGVNILAFVNTGTTVGIGTLNVSGSYTLLNNGFLRSDNGITTFTVGRDVSSTGPVPTALISVRNPNTGKVGTITVGRWNNAANVDFVADTIGTMNVTGYTALDIPSKVNGDFLASNFVLLNNSKADATSITVANNQNVANLLAPGGIGTLTVSNQLLGEVDADNPKGTLGAIAMLQAGQIGVFGVSVPTAIPATLRAVTFGTVKTVINVPLGADGSMNGSTVTATSGTAATGIATVSIASIVTNNFAGTTSTFNVPRSITTFTVAEDIRNRSQVAAGYATGSSITTFTAGAIANSVLTARSIATMNVIGQSPTVANAGVVVANVSNSVVTALGNIAGVGLGAVTIAQKVVNSDFNIAGGNVTSMTVGGIFGSHVLVGAHSAAYDNIVAKAAAANWDAPVAGVTFKLGSFKTTGLFDKTDVLDTANFRDSFIIAQQLGTVTITGLDQNVPAATVTSGGSAAATFGVAFRGTAGAGPKITVTFSNAGVLTTQTLTAPATSTSPPASTTPPSAFKYVNLAG
jgi:hypothetical protein